MLQIRQSTPEDAAALARLVTDLGYPVDPAGMAARLGSLSPDHRTLVAEVDGQIAGFIGMVKFPIYEASAPIGYILALSVSPAHQGQGIGRALMAAAEQCFLDLGVRDVRVTSGLHRPEAHGFYEALGYAKTGYRFRKVLDAAS
ncbi:N-acetyltransferase family protein [Luteolibacter sp. Populi]|uniref:GNAT family N-acetyltransferase n=1 Tax=Luteolibacter sp. Populi TaxID=3230487 RepID=UPI0034651692